MFSQNINNHWDHTNKLNNNEFVMILSAGRTLESKVPRGSNAEMSEYFCFSSLQILFRVQKMPFLGGPPFLTIWAVLYI